MNTKKSQVFSTLLLAGLLLVFVAPVAAQDGGNVQGINVEDATVSGDATVLDNYSWNGPTGTHSPVDYTHATVSADDLVTGSPTVEASQPGEPQPGPQPPALQDPSDVEVTNIVDTTVTGGFYSGVGDSQVGSTAIDGRTILNDYPQNGASIFDPIAGSVYAGKFSLNSEFTAALDERFAPVAVGQHTGLVGLPIQTDTYEDAADLLNFQQQDGIANKPEQEVIVTFEINGDADADTQTITADFDEVAVAGLEINDTLSTVQVIGNGLNTVTDTTVSTAANEITATVETNSDTDAQLVADVVYEPSNPVNGLDIDGGVDDLAVIGESPNRDIERDRFLVAEVGATAISHADVDRAAISANGGFIGQPVEDDTGTGVSLSSVNDADGQQNPGSFLIWQDQMVTFETAARGNTIEIYEAVQREDGNDVVHAKGDLVANLGTAPGQVANLDTSTLTAGKYFVDFESTGANTAVVLDVKTLDLTASTPSEVVSETENVEIDVLTGDITGGNVEAWFFGAGDSSISDVIHVEQDTLPGTGDRTIPIDPESDLNGEGEYYAIVEHAESEVAVQTETFEVGQSAPANFQVTIDGTNSPVTEGDTLNVDVTVENTGDQQGTQTINLDAPALGTDSTQVQLAGGSNSQETLSVGTSSGDAGSYTVTVSSDDDSDSQQVTVDPPSAGPQPTLEFNDQNLNDGQTGSVLVENIDQDGAASTAVLVTYESGGDLIVAGVAPPSEVSNGDINVSIDDTGGFPGDHTAHIVPASGASQPYQPGDTVSSATAANITDQQTATISQASQPDPANYQVTIDSTNSPVTEGDDLTVTATIENTGDQQGDQTVELDAQALGTDSASLQLAGGASTQQTFTAGTSSGDAGSYTATVSSENDTASQGVTVDPAQQPDPANFQLSNIQPADATITQGDVIDISADVTNTGDQSETQIITLSVAGITLTQSQQLAGGASTTVTFQNLDSSVVGPGDYTHTISSEDDSVSGSLTVEPAVQPQPGPQPPALEDPSDVEVTNIVDTTVTGGFYSGVGDSQVGSTAIDGRTILDDYPQNGASIFDPIVGSVYAEESSLNSQFTNAIDERFAPVAVGQHTGIVGLPVQTDTYKHVDDLLNFQQQDGIANKPEQEVVVTFEIDGGASADTQVITADFNEPAEAGLELNDTLSTVQVVGNGANAVTDTSVDAAANEITATVETTADTDAQLVADVVYEPSDPVEGLNIDGGIDDLAVVAEGPEGDSERDRFLAAEVGATAISHADVDRAAASANNGFIGEPVENNTGAGVDLSSVNDADGQQNPGSFLVWQDQTVTFETAERGNTIEIYEAVQREDGNDVVHAKGDLVANLGTAPGQVANLDTSTLDPGKYFVDFESAGDNSAVVLDVKTLDLTVSAPSETVPETETVEIAVSTGDITGGNVEAWVFQAGDSGVSDVLHVEQDTLPGTGDRTIQIDPENDLNGGGEYYAIVEHTESEVAAQTGVFRIGQSASVNFQVDITGTNTPVDVGEDLSVDATVTNTGRQQATQSIGLDVPGLGTDSELINLVAGESGNVSLSVQTAPGDAGIYTPTVSSENDSSTLTRATVQPPKLSPGLPGSPQDLDGNGLFEDVRGDGEFNILDVQELFNSLGTPDVKNDTAAFDFFQGPNDEVNILDVQELFNELQEQGN